MLAVTFLLLFVICYLRNNFSSVCRLGGEEYCFFNMLRIVIWISTFMSTCSSKTAIIE
jgi:hypothetical protein